MTKLNYIDEIERVVQKVRPVELEKGTVNRLFKEAIDAIDEASEHSSLKRIKRDYVERLNQVAKNSNANPLKVGIVGEIYVVLEPFANMDLEVELGKLGVEVKRTLSYSRWAKYSFYLNPLGIDEWRKVHRAAMPYLKRDVGGDGWESVGEKVLHSQEYDGIIHVVPFTCLPEVIAQNIMPSTKEQIPVLTLICDEQMGKGGMLTRLEAFVDLLQRRRRKK
jgi:predicted nucleotide-binding protein (sugar kinase/HSP70/actin superfamily)